MSRRGKHPHNRLKAAGLRVLPPGRHADGNRLYFLVRLNLARSWVQRVTVEGSRIDLGLGPYPLISLAEARRLAIDNLLTIRAGGVQRQLLLPLGVSHFCRFRSSWIEINNDDACGPCGRRLRRPKRGGKRAASTVTHCRSARARFPCRWRGPQAARLPDGPECSRGRPAVGSGQQRTGSTPAGSRRRRRFPRERSVRQLGTLEMATSKGTGRPRRRRLQPRGRRVRSVGTLPNPGRPPRPVSRRGRPGRRRPGRAAGP